MKILLTGANGFVGSHLLDSLQARGLPTAILLRPTSNTRFIQKHLSCVEVRTGDFAQPESLRQALAGITHVIHCAGCTKARRAGDFFAGNQAVTRNLIAAASAPPAALERFFLISSLAAAGPSAPGRPRRIEDPDAPISEYGKSKLAAEEELKKHCRAEYVIFRPPGVYGPRDAEFLKLFKAVKSRLLPVSPQQFSLVCARDLAEITVEALLKPAAANRTWYVAHPEVVTARQMGEQIAAELQTRLIPLPLSRALLWLVCAGAEFRGRLSGKPGVLGLLKYPELCAPGWVCDPEPLRRALGLVCPTALPDGLRQTLAWYRQNQWL